MINKIKKRMKSTNQSWHLGSGVGVGEVSVCRQPGVQSVVVTGGSVWITVTTGPVGQEEDVEPVLLLVIVHE
jgi:hypothetical protein